MSFDLSIVLHLCCFFFLASNGVLDESKFISLDCSISFNFAFARDGFCKGGNFVSFLSFNCNFSFLVRVLSWRFCLIFCIISYSFLLNFSFLSKGTRNFHFSDLIATFLPSF